MDSFFLCRVGEPQGADQFSCGQAEGVEDHYPSLDAATTATALDLECARLQIELSVHSSAASKLDHMKLLASP
jgi:hypothetical protein